jgi:hypothetical protein
MTSRMSFELIGFHLSTNAKVKKMTTVSALCLKSLKCMYFKFICINFFACCMLKQNRDLFYFWVYSRIYTPLWQDFSCFRRLILSLSWKSNDRGGLKFWTCLHATVLLAVKYSAEINKYILLVRVICEKYRLRGEVNIPSRFSGEGHLTVLTNRIYLYTVIVHW